MVDYGFGPYRWVCTTGDPNDLRKTDAIAAEVLKSMLADAPADTVSRYKTISGGLSRRGGIKWSSVAKHAFCMRTMLGDCHCIGHERGHCQRRYWSCDSGRDHHDVSGTDSPYRETSNIRDGSMFTADMAVQK